MAYLFQHSFKEPDPDHHKKLIHDMAEMFKGLPDHPTKIYVWDDETGGLVEVKSISQIITPNSKPA